MAFFGGGGASVDLASPPAIGNTTPNTGAFTTLSFAPANNTTGFSNTSNSLTGSNAQSLINLAQTWNTTGTPTAINLNITNTASNSSSKFIDFQIGGISQCFVGYNGANPVFNIKSTTATVYSIAGNGASLLFYYGASISNSIVFTFGVPGIVMPSTGSYGFGASTDVSSGAGDLYLVRDAANILAQRRTTNAQTFRLYNTFTDASNYERGFFRWNTNVLEIGAEAAGTGTQRQLRFPLGTVTASTPLSITQTWNGAGVTFTGLQLNATDTASATGSLLFDFQVGGSSKCRVSKNGDLTITGGFNCTQNSTLDGIITRQAAMYGGSDANGTLILQNSNFNNFNMLKIGGTSTSFPALKRSSAILQVRLADDSGYTVLDAQLRAQGTAPATSGATGTAGDIRYDADYIYICTATNTWKRVAIATWP